MIELAETGEKCAKVAVLEAIDVYDRVHFKLQRKVLFQAERQKVEKSERVQP